MIGKYHTSITNEALGESFNGYAINYINKGNIDSDELRNEIIGISDGYNLSAQHFNKTSLEECQKFLDNAQEVVIDDFIEAAKANSNEDEYYEQAFYDFGRLIHNIQDFYSHTNWINFNKDEIWNEDIDNPNLEENQTLKTGEYSYFSQFLDQINPFYKNYLSKNYEEICEGKSSISHYGMNKDEPGTIADKLYEEKYGTSGFSAAADCAREHSEKKWEEIDNILKKELSGREYRKMKQEIADFNMTQVDFDENLNTLRENFNSDIKELD